MMLRISRVEGAGYEDVQLKCSHFRHYGHIPDESQILLESPSRTMAFAEGLEDGPHESYICIVS